MFFLKEPTHNIIIQKQKQKQTQKQSHVKIIVESLVHFKFNSFPEVLLLLKVI